ncbi:MAG: 50S ribosomal protein L18a [Thermoplasmata archaeon]|nr:MAG: 50S ribosomal protein L18a [Thermoplasmata archaeon]
MKVFRVKGTFLMGNRWQDFTKEVVGDDENVAKEQIYSRLGSKHRVKRKKIQIEEVKEISIEEVSDPIASYLIKRDNDNKIKKTKKGEING